MNQGVVVKFNANQKYQTSLRCKAASTAVRYPSLSHALCPCRRTIGRTVIPHEGVSEPANAAAIKYTNRSDMAGGSTLGNISNTQVSLQAVDIGMPQLAMHSSCEMAGAKDTAYLAAARFVARDFSGP